MLNKTTISVLQSIVPITNSVLIEYPKMYIQNLGRGVLGSIDLEILGEEEFEEFGIFDLSSFLGAVSVLEEPSITLKDGIITAKDMDSEIQFVVSTPSSVEAFTTNPDNITTSVAENSILEVKISTDTLGKIRKGINLFKNLKDIFITKNDKGVFLRTGNKENFNRLSNSYTVKLETDLDDCDDFEIAFPAENFLSLPVIDYTLHVKHNARLDVYRVVIENDIYQFVLPMKM